MADELKIKENMSFFCQNAAVGGEVAVLGRELACRANYMFQWRQVTGQKVHPSCGEFVVGLSGVPVGQAGWIERKCVG